MTELEEKTEEYIKNFETEYAFSDVTETDKTARYYFLSKVYKDGYTDGQTELKEQIQKQKEINKEYVDETEELKLQIRKMQCCGNCKYLHCTYQSEIQNNGAIQYEKYGCKKGGFSMGHCDEWELKND